MLEFLSPSPSGCRSICPSSFPSSIPSTLLFPRLPPFFCPPVFPFAHSLALCRTRNAIYRAEFIERVRAFTHANVYSLRKIRDNIAPRFAAPEILRCVIQLLIEIFFFLKKLPGKVVLKDQVF